MEPDWKPTLETFVLFLALVWPGLLAVNVYRLIVPGPRFEWKDAVLQGFFFTVINYVVTFPIALFVANPDNVNQPVKYWSRLVTVLLVAPVVLPFLWTWLLRRKWMGRLVQSPYPTPWDWYFSRRHPAFLLIHLKDGSLVGGYWGEGSYASSYPDQGDIYLSSVYKVNSQGVFGAPIDDTDGLLIRKDEYTFIELFKSPEEEESHD